MECTGDDSNSGKATRVGGIPWHTHTHTIFLLYVTIIAFIDNCINSMEQNPIWDITNKSVKKFPAFYWNRRIITVFTSSTNSEGLWSIS